ncbi:hypothetical protein KNE206_68650 [Kitasatospora sp. NE20-6]|uniref:hypothetical protein n=1 Tax=Kitasatospora sp. NE20-6 TaxID=2859066 RepID=UPI0034DC490F
MSVFDRIPHEPPRPGLDGHPSRELLRLASRRLRRRLLAVNAAVGLAVSLLASTAGSRLATPLPGGCTLGMLLLSLQAATVPASALWYDRACRTHCDPHADVLARAPYGHGTGQVRP